MALTLLLLLRMELIVRLLIVIVIAASYGTAHGAVICDRPILRQAIADARTSAHVQELATMPVEKWRKASTPRLTKIFERLQKKTFGRHVLQLVDFPLWPGLTTVHNMIEFSPITDRSLQANLADPDLGAAFEIAHEFGHIIQDVSFLQRPDHLSPHGLKKADPDQEWLDYNTLHGETDCLAAEILYEAGYRIDYEQIMKTLDLITQQCRSERPQEFCDQAAEIRGQSLGLYLRLLLTLKPQT
jgi:hypothetical protein